MKYTPLYEEREDPRFAEPAKLVAENLMEMLSDGLIEWLSIDHIVRAVETFCSDLGYSNDELNTIVDMANREVVLMACYPKRRVA